MSRTSRKNYKEQTIRDGEHGKHCPSNGCNYCVTGESKFWFKRKFRREQKKIIKGETNES